MSITDELKNTIISNCIDNKLNIEITKMKQR